MVERERESYFTLNTKDQQVITVVSHAFLPGLNGNRALACSGEKQFQKEKEKRKKRKVRPGDHPSSMFCTGCDVIPMGRAAGVKGECVGALGKVLT